MRQLEIILLIAAQAGLAAALSRWFAYSVLGNPNPVFAPTAAVGTIAAAIGQRGRRTLELLIGVGLGIAIGDGLVSLIGTGPWQTGVIVALAIAVALGLAGRGGTVVSQVGGTAVLIATLSSSQQNLELPRVVDAVTGSLVMSCFGGRMTAAETRLDRGSPGSQRPAGGVGYGGAIPLGLKNGA
ncbi:FUSC family protein [Micromonospora sp. WMMD1155]|uniref:FUSC family protein n=1 Tax=Micromonospora sp. WMMD1155 TaxID=3016094 RepID=UPI00249C4506|nr:FUSC family protein [Micromonospora sp. WMMD1155]WFE53209.1 FUSC family protein [Micromonospora sp. WMMD1155]